MTNIILSHRVQSIKPSATLAMAALAGRLKAEGKSIVSLATGEPDFDTPDFIKQAGIAAIESGFTKYTPADGIVELKQAVIDKYKRENHLTYTLPQVMISAGAKDCLFNLAQALLNPGDEVIIPAPYWVSYPDITLLAEGIPVIISTSFEANYKITAEQLEKAITPKTRLFIINSPSNPSGKAYTPEELLALAKVLLKYPDVLIATDDIYEAILWSQECFQNILSVCPELYERTIVLNSASKTYAMTGWRIGYALGPVPLIKAMTNIQSQSISNPTSMAQKAAVVALNGSQQPVLDMVQAYQTRHEYLYHEFKNIPGVRVSPADGTFYLFLDIQEIINAKGLVNDIAFTEKLLADVGLALVAGSAFGVEGAVRLSFAASMETLKEAVLRFKKFCQT
jgi:aspartate aminotransferase